MQKLPIGESTFRELIRAQTLYVDKTQYLYNLIKAGRVRYFFSRPRRFGKSLTCSTLESIFSGHKEFFNDLWIGKSDYQWQTYPVVFFDFSQIDHSTPEELVEGLQSSIKSYAKQYGVVSEEKLLKTQFAELIKKLGEKLGPVAVIVDEYDKPLTNLIDDQAQREKTQSVLREFYGTLKGKDADAHLHALFITGVSKFSKVALFSELNNLEDLTHDKRAAALVGYSDEEVDAHLTEHIEALADERNESYEQARQILKTWYNGYRFSDDRQTVYNPFSLHNCLNKKDVDNYWFSSGTPNFLMKFIKKNPNIAYEIEEIDGSFFAKSNFESFTVDLYYQNYKTLLLQTGYLTIASDYDTERRGYKVAYPNEEVRYSMTEQIMRVVGQISPEQFGEFGSRFSSALARDNLGLFCQHLQNFIKLVPHNIRVDREKFYQQLFFMVCVLFGKRPATEVATEEGFMDLLLEGNNNTFVIEFKKNSSAAKALQQIEEKRYWEPYHILKNKKIILAGITFNHTADGVVVEWLSKEL